MVQTQLEVRGHSAASAERVWSVAGQFLARWHPLIASMTSEKAANGAPVRAFTVHGDDTVYREQLIYHSHSDRTMRYALLEGIDGADRYIGSLCVEPGEEGGCDIVCGAVIEACEPRAEAIKNGTRAIFQAGIDALIAAGADSRASSSDSDAATTDIAPSQTRIIAGEPMLACEVAGDAPAPLCLFLHGIGGCRQNWQAQLGALGKHVQAVAMDLRGYGDSTAGDRQTRIDDYCDDILRVCEAFNASRLILCGLSYGAWIATAFAQRYPQMLDGLVLSGGCTGMSEASANEQESFRRAREEPLNNGLAPADFAKDVVNVISGPNATADVLQQLRDSMAAIPVHTYRDAINCFTRPPARFDFSKLVMPVLLMTGEHDRLAPPAEIRGVADRITQALLQQSDTLPDVQFEQITAAGHVCNLEQSEQYNRWLLQFVSRLST